MLQLEDVHASYGNISALKGVSLEVQSGEMAAIVGANGAGKTTLLHCISGIMPYTGKIMFEGEDIAKWGTKKIVSSGIVQVPEGRQIFGEMTVLENLRLGAFVRNDKLNDDIEKMFHMFPRLEERKHQKGASLSGGEQQMLALCRALMAKPRLLMLDEPSMGLAPVIVQGLFKNIKEINESGVTIILIEQNAKLALKTADTAFIMEIGEIKLAGSAKDLRNDKKVQDLYLGG
ncbi:MAG: ABC transporter ATP-binding protein [Eubacteriales bacterium]|nr:ABC transporter ATP-binding protein [Eubacteriales bacterium]